VPQEATKKYGLQPLRDFSIEAKHSVFSPIPSHLVVECIGDYATALIGISTEL
jgi:hypothetical protein